MISSAFQQQLEAACQLHHSSLHPFTIAWVDGKMSREQLGRWAEQHYYYQ
jgi:pyrroloquinoline-quinone synthase